MHRHVEDGLCEDVYTFVRPPVGRFGRMRARRLAPCEAGGEPAPVVLYLPGMHMNGSLPRDPSAPDLRRYLATRGVRVWSVDYRTYAVPPDATDRDLRELQAWTAGVFADDVASIATFVRTQDHGPLYVVGFSFGAGLAYRLAARGLAMDGLVILDGAPPGERGAPAGDDPAIDVGGARLPYADRQRLLAAVLDDPAGTSPVAGFANAGEALTMIVHSARAFGGDGGLSAVKAGRTDVRALAGLLATYDRWWPRATLGGDTVTPLTRTLRVLAFATTNMGPAWVDRVRAGARAFGGDDAVVHEIRGYGHVDVLVGRDAPELVFEPIRRFVTARASQSDVARSRVPSLVASVLNRASQHAPVEAWTSTMTGAVHPRLSTLSAAPLPATTSVARPSSPVFRLADTNPSGAPDRLRYRNPIGVVVQHGAAAQSVSGGRVGPRRSCGVPAGES